MDKDTLTELLYSKDVENKKLGVSFIKNNFKYPEYTYYESDLVSQCFSFISQEKYNCLSDRSAPKPAASICVDTVGAQ